MRKSVDRIHWSMPITVLYRRPAGQFKSLISTFEDIPADETSVGFQECFMNVVATFESGIREVEPTCVARLDRLAVLAQCCFHYDWNAARRPAIGYAQATRIDLPPMFRLRQ